MLRRVIQVECGNSIEMEQQINVCHLLNILTQWRFVRFFYILSITFMVDLNGWLNGKKQRSGKAKKESKARVETI